MSNTREIYDQAKAAMALSGLGEFQERKMPASGGLESGYMYSTLNAQAEADVAPLVISDWMELAIKVNGYLTVNTYENASYVGMQIAVSLDL
jgi:hypothetical protein